MKEYDWQKVTETRVHLNIDNANHYSILQTTVSENKSISKQYLPNGCHELKGKLFLQCKKYIIKTVILDLTGLV